MIDEITGLDTTESGRVVSTPRNIKILNAKGLESSELSVGDAEPGVLDWRPNGNLMHLFVFGGNLIACDSEDETRVLPLGGTSWSPYEPFAEDLKRAAYGWFGVVGNVKKGWTVVDAIEWKPVRNDKVWSNLLECNARHIVEVLGHK